MTTLLVTSTAEGTGKTAISIAIARLAQRHGASVSYMKPKGTRLESAVGKTRDEDPLMARELLDIDAEMADLEPVVYSPTFVTEAVRGREDPAALRERVAESFERLAADRDVMVVEGGGRLWTGGIVELADADVAGLLDAEAMLVSPYEDVMALDDVLAAATALEDSLGGVLFNGVNDGDFDEVTDDAVPFLDGRGIETYGVLPRDERLAGVSVSDLAEGIGARLLTDDAPTDGLVERFLVGAMGASAALEQFRRTRHAAVVTGGDRSDLQTAALEASGIECLVLTGGYTPPNAVLGKAEARGVPVMLVRSDTSTTVDRVERTLGSARTRDPEAVERMESLLADSLDVPALLSLDG